MKKHLSINIQNPCSEKWEQFERSATGGFCASCQKTVIDFTGMADHDIATYFATSTGNTCGRFRTDQLKTYSVKPAIHVTPGLTLLKAGMICLVLMLASRPSPAQSVTDRPKTELVSINEPPIMGKTSISEDYLVRGVVKTQEDSLPLPGTNVNLKGTTQGTITDANGAFEFPQRLKDGDVLVFSFIGFETQEFIVHKGMPEIINLQMVMAGDILGDVVVGGVCTTHHSGVRRLWEKVRNIF